MLTLDYLRVTTVNSGLVLDGSIGVQTNFLYLFLPREEASGLNHNGATGIILGMYNTHLDVG